MKPDDDIIIDETEQPAAPALAAADLNEDADADRILPRGAELNADKSVTLTLDYPVTVKIRSAAGTVRDERFDRLVFHRLTGADLNAMRSTAPEHQQMLLFTRSTRIRSAVMSALYPRLDGADIMRCGQVLNTFL